MLGEEWRGCHVEVTKLKFQRNQSNRRGSSLFQLRKKTHFETNSLTASNNKVSKTTILWRVVKTNLPVFEVELEYNCSIHKPGRLCLGMACAMYTVYICVYSVLGWILLKCIQLQNTEYMPKNVICNVIRHITQSEYCIMNTWITSTLKCIL